MNLPPLALYVHIPWCVRKCPYCDFNSHAQGEENLPEAAYVDQLLRDLDCERTAAAERELGSIFIGGGTPSLFSAAAFDQLLNGVASRLSLPSTAEITLEANPGTFEQERFNGFAAAGINRLSIGIQSFDNQRLKALGRIHGADEARAAVPMARRAGFNNINLDIMYALPGQDVAAALADLEAAIALEPEHLSWYQLTLEPNTEFYRRPPSLPDEDTSDAITDAGLELLDKHGYQRYEVSAFSRQQPSQHNLNYWEFGDYLGIGAGAHGKVSHRDGRIERSRKTRLPRHYLEQIPTGGLRETIDPQALPVEFMMNALRLREGVPTDYFSARTGLPLPVIGDQLRQLHQRQLIHDPTQRLQLTEQGYRFLNSVLDAFM